MDVAETFTLTDFVIEPYVTLPTNGVALQPLTNTVTFTTRGASSLTLSAPLDLVLLGGPDRPEYSAELTLRVCDAATPDVCTDGVVNDTDLPLHRVIPRNAGAPVTLTKVVENAKAGTYAVTVMGRAEFASFRVLTRGSINVLAVRTDERAAVRRQQRNYAQCM
jgi:hypothetical protein